MSSLWIGAAVLALSIGRSPAEEPHLELIRGLRARGDAALALEYLEERVPKNLPPEVARVFALELARTRADVAREESEEGKRLALFAAARAEFDAFLKANPDHPLAPQIRFEVARLTAARGKEAVTRARRLEGEAKQKAYAEARPSFTDAIAQLRDAAKLLKARRDAAKDPAEIRDLTQSWLTAHLEEGTNLFQLAFTHATATPAGNEELKKRAAHLAEAAKVFERLATLVDKNPICWLAQAWLARCHYENDDYQKATDQFELIQTERGLHADDAKRVAAYFRIRMTLKQGTVTPTAQLTQLLAWLERYRAYQNSPEGCGVRFFIADTQAAIAASGVKSNDKGRPISVTPEAGARLKDADRRLRELTEFENDFTELAANRRMSIILAIAIRETPDRDPAKLTSFENCYLLALLEVAELNEELKTPEVMDEPEKAARLRKKHYVAAVRAIDRGLKLVKPTDPPKEVLDARIMLVYANFVAGENYHAAVLGEHLARSMTRSGRGALPALYALQAYRNVMLKSKAHGAANEAELQTDREHVRRVATWMEATWPNDTPTDTARHTLGTLYFADGDYAKALETYARVTPNYASLAFLRNEQGIACFNLQKDPKAPAQTKKDWFGRITAELTAMPDLGAGAAPETAYAYCLARLQLATLLQHEGKQFERVEQIGRAVMDASQKLALGPKAGEVKYHAQTVAIYGLYGIVYTLVKENRHLDAAKLYQPVFDEFAKTPLPADDEAAQKPRRAMAELLQLALRSSVIEGDIGRAQKLLKQLETATAGSGGANSALVAVLKEVQAQIAEMRKNSDPMHLSDTVKKFGDFLETLANQANLSKEVKLFLAQGFAALGKAARGVELLASIAAPTAAPAPPPANASDDERSKYEAAKAVHEQEARTFWFTQLTHVRVLRQAALAETEAEKRQKLFQTADQMLDAMIGTPQRQGWGFNSLEVRREKIFVLEDRGRFADAMQQWTVNQRPFLKQMQDRMVELELLKRATPEVMTKELQAAVARLTPTDQATLQERQSWLQGVAKKRYDEALAAIEAAKVTPAVHFIQQKRLLAMKLANVATLQAEVAAAPESVERRWLRDEIIAKKVRLDPGNREIERYLRTKAGEKDGKRMDPTAKRALLETTLLMAAFSGKPQLDAEFQRYREIVYTYHFYKIRCVYLSKVRNEVLAKDAAKKTAEYKKLAATIIKVEKDEQTSDYGGNLVRKLYKEMLDDDELLKKSYVSEGGTALLTN